MKNLISSLCVLAALGLLAATCLYCYPSLEGKLRQAVAGLEDSPVREAFAVMADGLEAGESVRDTMDMTVQVLFGQQG